MHTIDLTIIILFLAGMASYGFWQSKFNKTPSDYFLGGRNLPWVVAMFSIVATETSVLTFISVPGLAYRGNWFFLQLAMGYIIGRILVSIILLPQYYKSGVTSIYEVLGNRFGRNIQKTASGVFLVTRVLADGVRFLATAVIVQVVTGWSLPVAVLIIGAVTLIYTLYGGIKTIVWIDSFQFILYIAGAVISIAFILNHLDTSIGDIFSGLLTQNKFQILQFGENIFTSAWMFPSALFGGILLSFASHGADYMMVQRVLGCRNLKSAQKAMIGSGFFVFLQFAVFLLAGTLIYQLYCGIDLQKDREFSTFIVEHLPVGVRGILLAGVLSAAMSTLSSSINSLASSTVADWMKNVSLKRSQFISFIWAIVLIGIALLFDETDNAIVVVGLKIASYTYGGLLGLFIISQMKRDFHPIALIVGLISSLVIVFGLQNIGLAWTWFIGISTVTNIVVVFIVNEIIKLTRS